MAITSLKRQRHQLADASRQLRLLNEPDEQGRHFTPFEEKLNASGLYPLRPESIDILQINLGKMCNQTCRHCHVDAGPDRKEIMTRDTMEHVLKAVHHSDIKTVDLTGGAPEMNPDFRWFVNELKKLDVHIIVRCNLTIILANPSYHDLPDFYKEHDIEVVSSLPYFTALRTDAQRGKGVFGKSIEALQLLNEKGYGTGNGLTLNLVYNPSGAFLPGDQASLEKEFKQKLNAKYGITFDQLYTITNLPISRFLDYLVNSGNYESYMQELIDAYNPAAAAGVMCRNTLSVGWQGELYDCDFNQMLEIGVDRSAPAHIKDFDKEKLTHRTIMTNQHCYGCTAGAGSSCGGTTA